MHDKALQNRVVGAGDLDRRKFVQSIGMLGLSAALPVVARVDTDVKGADLKTPSGKPLRGLYPIVETPFTAADKLDTEVLAAEVRSSTAGASTA